MTRLAAAFLLLAALAPSASPVASVQDPDPGVGLAEVRADPARHLGRRVRFVVQLAGSYETWNPFLSRFGPAAWTAFEAWPDERFAWDLDVFEDPAQRLFVRRGSPAAVTLAAARPYRRLEVTGVVREVFLDEPWIEVQNLTPLSEFVSEGSILHAARGERFEDEGLFARAIEQYERALVAPLPAHARDELEGRIARCRLAAEIRQRKRR